MLPFWQMGFMVRKGSSACWTPHASLCAQLHGQLEVCWAAFVTNMAIEDMSVAPVLQRHFERVILDSSIPKQWQCAWLPDKDVSVVVRNRSPLFATVQLYDVNQWSRVPVLRVAAPSGTEWELRPKRALGSEILMEVTDDDGSVISSKIISRGSVRFLFYFGRKLYYCFVVLCFKCDRELFSVEIIAL